MFLKACMRQKIQLITYPFRTYVLLAFKFCHLHCLGLNSEAIVFKKAQKHNQKIQYFLSMYSQV